jgi:hypothetical protein
MVSKSFIVLAAALFQPQPARDSAHFSFHDIAPTSGVKFVLTNSATPAKYQIETMISGVALFDYNNDGWLDIFFVNGASIPELRKAGPQHYNRLYRNEKDGTFTDVTERAGVSGRGYSMGVAAADYDNDGYQDLYITGVNFNQLLRNNGDGTFSDVTVKAGVEGIHPKFGKTWAISAGWFDYDNDGHLDLFVTNYVQWDPDHEPDCRVNRFRTYCAPDRYEGLPSFLYHNNGDGTFTDVSVESGIGLLAGKGMGVAFADYDGDGYTDIFVANDSFRNFFFRNNGNGRFSEIGILVGVAYNDNGKSIAAMGADFRDVDNDGKPDIFVTGMVNDTFPLYRNGGKLFEDVTTRSGVARATLRLTGWSNGIFDFDNDGSKDLFAANGSILDNSWEVERLPAKLPNLILRNEGSSFRDNSATSGEGLKTARMHRGAAFGDLNNDGRVDIVTVSLNERPEILINGSSPSNHWLTLKLTGSRSNRDAIGARIKITPQSGPPQFNHVTSSVGLSSSSDHRVHFGLGPARIIKTIEILWPSGKQQVLEDVPADQILAVREP